MAVDVNVATSAAVTFLTRQGFTHINNSHSQAPNGLYTHPTGVHAHVWNKAYTDRVEITFDGPLISRAKTIKYTVDNLGALYSRTRRVLLAATKENARQRKINQQLAAKRNMIVDAVREFGIVELLPPQQIAPTNVYVSYRQCTACVYLVDGKLCTSINIGNGYRTIQLTQWTEIVDLITNHGEQ